MIYRGVDTEKIQSIEYLDLRDYLIINSWNVSHIENASIYIFKKNSYEIVISNEIDFLDRSRRIIDALKTIQEVENKEIPQILSDISYTGVDVLRFRLGGPVAENGTIPLDLGIDLFNGSKKALLASACMAIDPQKYHSRLHRADAETFLNSCRIGQTENRSFSTTLLCPIEITPDSGTEPSGGFSRQATTTLFSSTASVLNAIDNDSVEQLMQSETPVISGNICEALLQMMPSERGSSFLEISANWSPKIPAPLTVQSRVLFTPSYYERVVTFAKELRPQYSPQSAKMVARVDGLNGRPDADGRVRGEVILVFIDDSGELVKAKVDLMAEDYQKALTAHGSNKHLALKGILHKGAGRRSSQIQLPSEVEVITTS